MLVLTTDVSIVAVHVRLTGVPSYSVVVLEGVMVRVSWGGGTAKAIRILLFQLK